MRNAISIRYQRLKLRCSRLANNKQLTLDKANGGLIGPASKTERFPNWLTMPLRSQPKPRLRAANAYYERLSSAVSSCAAICQLIGS